MKGRFITFEGGEGSGKSTQVQLLKIALERANIPHVLTREPGGEKGAEDIRKLLVTGDKNAWEPQAEALLFYAARYQHFTRLIKPSLEQNKIVICDRFADSTRVYQGIGEGAGADFIDRLHHLTLGDFKPSLTIILDIDPKIGLQRAKSRHGSETRFEEMSYNFHTAVRSGFLSIADKEPERCKIIDASQSKDIIHQQILQLVSL